MVVEEHSFQWTPIGAPLNSVQQQRDEPLSPFTSSVNALSFGFVATAILISMFLVVAIIERFLRPSLPELSPSGRRRNEDLEAQLEFNGKLGYPSAEMSEYASGVSVLMPGDDTPSYIAYPVSVPCPPGQHVSASTSTHIIANLNQSSG